MYNRSLIVVERLSEKKLDLEKTVEVLKTNGVSFDIDGVESASAVISLKEFNSNHGLKMGMPKTMDDVKDYGIMIDWISKDPDIKDPIKAAEAIWNKKETLEGAGRVQGVDTVLKYLSRKGITPYRITSRPGYTREYTYNWYLKQYGDDFDLGLIRMQDEKRMEISPDFKASEAARLNIGYHFEDSYENAEKVAEKGVVVVLVPQPWNVNYQPKYENILVPKDFEHRMKVTRAFLTLSEFITENR